MDYESTLHRYSVREQEPDTNGGVSTSLFWYSGQTDDDLLTAWGSPYRDVQLRAYDVALHNTLWQGAKSGLIKRIAATPYEISGGRNLTKRYQDVLQNAEFGQGWKTLIAKFLADYYTQDFGSVIEVIGAGQPDRPLTGQVLGLSHLDRFRCVATGNYEYPIIYYSERTGAMHKMHHTRVIRQTDMPSPNARAYGNGLCALSRVLGMSNAQILMGRYQNEKLTNEPPAGIVTIANVKPGDVDAFKAQWNAERNRNGESVFAPIMTMQGVNPEYPVKVEFTPFASLPDHFNLRDYMETHVNMLALGLNEDVQEIWPLTGQAMGTGTQSRILDKKGQAKAFADALTMIERMINLWILPESLEFKFKYADGDADKQAADTAQVWAGVATSLKATGNLTTDEARRLLANQVPAFADVLLDEAGNIRLPDDDEKADGQEVIADDTTDLQTEQQASQPQATQTDDEQAPTEENKQGLDQAPQFKDYLSTESSFIRDVSSLVQAGLDSEVNRRRFSTVMRSLLAKYGRSAYLDGLQDGGVEVDSLDQDGQTEVASWLSEQSEYVTAFSERVFSGDSQITPEARAIAWANKSLDGAYQKGLLSADANGMYQWHYGDTEHCEDCRRLNGQRHRLKEWHKEGWIPRSSKLECNGYNCKCELVKTSGRVKGNY